VNKAVNLTITGAHINLLDHSHCNSPSNISLTKSPRLADSAVEAWQQDSYRESKEQPKPEVTEGSDKKSKKSIPKVEIKNRTESITGVSPSKLESDQTEFFNKIIKDNEKKFKNAFWEKFKD
jgi:hypothetical protein